MEASKLTVPPNACDCHMHVYEERFALAPTATFKPPPAPASEYRKMQAALGLQRVVVVQPTAYGFDNTCTMEAVAALGAGARAIAVVPPDVSDAELERLTNAGARGLRFFMLPGGVYSWPQLAPMAARVAAQGWHVQLQLDGRLLPEHERGTVQAALRSRDRSQRQISRAGGHHPSRVPIPAALAGHGTLLGEAVCALRNFQIRAP